MKILVVCQHFYPENFRINDICFELVKRGHDVTVLTGLPNYPKGKVLKEYKWFKNKNQCINGVYIKRCLLVGRGKSLFMMIINYLWFAIFGSIKALFMRKDFDLVYVYQLSPITMVYPAIVIKKLKKIPLIIHVLDQWPISITTGGISENSLVYKLLHKVSKSIYDNADMITISSKSFEKYFENILKIKKSEKKLIYLPSYAESDYKIKSTIKNKKFDIVFAGNIGPAQSVETIVEVANLMKENEDVSFHIVGDGLSYNLCKKLAEDYNLKNIKFYGYFDVKNITKFYELADAFIITMVNNEVVNSTLPAKIQSYMLAGKPIYGAINGEVKKVIEEANCGKCCESLNYKELANIILNTYKDKEQLKIWGKNSYNYYEKNFEKNKCIDEIEETMKKTIFKN